MRAAACCSARALCSRAGADSDRARAAAAVEARRPKGSPQQSRFWRWALTGEDRILRGSTGPHSAWWQRLRAETTDLVYDFRSWERLHTANHYLRLFTPVGLVRSDVGRRLIFPDLFVVFCSSSMLCFYNSFAAPLLNYTALTLPVEPFAISAMAVGLLATFRTQTSYARFNEARHLWTAATANSRELCSRILARIPIPRSNSDKHPDILHARICGAKLAQTFAHALKYHITIDGCNAKSQIVSSMSNEEIRAEKAEALRDELLLIWDLESAAERAIVERLLHPDVHNWPLQVCQELTHLNATQYVQPNPGGLGHPNSEGLDARITALQQIIADCEGILQTPIYTSYTQFTGRVLYIFVNTLPLALYPLIGPVWTPPVAVTVAFLFMGIDDIGMRVEQPFDNLPLWQYVEIVDRSCEQLMRNASKLG